ncbi:MAG: DUF1571 domain-containing protein [Myxococcales bacterium]|nr:DUF1571 domain-containing protein [Myxococcales bacterium]
MEALSSQATRAGLAPRQAGGLSVALLALILSWGGAAFAQAAASEVDQIQALLRRSSEALADVDDYRGTLVKRERFGDELIAQTMEFKFARPFKVYLKYVEPYPGREIIYIRGANRNKVRAHKGSVPDIPVSLRPFGRICMQGNHHPITSFGLKNMLRVAARSIRTAIVRGDSSVHLSDGGMVLGDPTWRIAIATTTSGRQVTVRGSENLWALAMRVGQDMYVILHHNDDVRSPRDVRPGQKVFVPRYYGSRGEFYFSKRTQLMIKAVTWDHRGKLYESYELEGIELNPGLEDRDFDYRNEEYGFVSR